MTNNVLKRWMCAILALFMLMTAIPASLAEEESAEATVQAAVYSAPEIQAAPAPEPDPQPATEAATSDGQSASENTETSGDAPSTPEQVFIVQLQLGDMSNLIYVPYGTLEVDLPLSSTLPAVYSNGTSGQVTVTWRCVGDSLGGQSYVPNHPNGEVVFYFQATPVGSLCSAEMVNPMVTVAYTSAPMAVVEHPDIEIAGNVITIARGKAVTTDDIVNEPGYDPSFLILNQGTIDEGAAEINNPVNGGTINGGTFNGHVSDADEYVLRINGGTFNGKVGNVDGEVVDAYVYIRGGEFHDDVKARNLLISGGTFEETSTVYLWTVGSISGGTFYGTVINHLGILNGPNTVPEFYGHVVNAQSPYGQIYGGRFYGTVDNSAGGKITSGAEFVQGQINNSGTIDAGTSTFSADVQIVNNADGKIAGGTFGCSIYNSGSIAGGTYNGPVVNLGMISGGAFYADMSNEGTIAGADLFGTLSVNTGTVSTEGITVDTENDKVIISAGQSVTTTEIMNAISDDQKGEITTVENNGTINGGETVVPYIVDNDHGEISGGSFSGEITGGKITGGTFSGGVNSDGAGVVTISGGTFNGNVGHMDAGQVFISGGEFNALVAARNLVISGGTFNVGSNVVLGAVGGISDGTFNGSVTTNFTLEGGTYNGKVVNRGKIYGGTYNGTIDNYGEITYISEYTYTQDIVDGEPSKQTQYVQQTYLNCTINDYGGYIYGPVKYGDKFNANGSRIYVMAQIIEADGTVKVYQDADFLANSNVLEGLAALDAKQNIHSEWTHADGSPIAAEAVFSMDANENQFKRTPYWEVVDGTLEIERNGGTDKMPEAGTYKSVHIQAGVTVSDLLCNVPVYNDGTISGGTYNQEVVNNGTITGGTLNGLVSSNEGSRIAGADFGANARFRDVPKGYVELSYTANGATYYAPYNTLMLKILEGISNEAYTDWYVIGSNGSETLVSATTSLTLSASRVYRSEKRVTPEIVWPTASVLPYGEKLSGAKLTSADRYGTFSWKEPNTVPAGAGTYYYTVVYKPTYTSYDYSGVELEKEIPVEVKRNAAVIAVSASQSKYYGDADPALKATVTGLRSGDKLNYTLVRAPGEAVGTYTISVELGDNPNYDVSVVTGTFTISAKPITAANGTLPDQTYTGVPAEPKPTVAVNGVTLVEGTDYTLTYYNNTGVGSAYVLVQGIGNYSGTRRLDFKIIKGSATITVNSATKVYGGADPAFTASVSGVAEGAKLNYSLKRAAGENAGTYTVSVSLGSNPDFNIATVNGTLTIEPKPLPAPAAMAAQTYSGSACTPKPAVKDGTKALTEGTDYTLRYSDNVSAGTASVTLTGKGNYTGTQTASFTINPRSAKITVDSAAKCVGTGDPALTAKVTGTVGTDKLNYTLTRAEGEEIGAYAITAVPGSNPNYSVTTASGTLTITAEPVSVAFSAAQLSLEAGDSAQLTLNMQPIGTTARLSYSTSDASVATVSDDGTVTAVKAGVATISVVTSNNKTAFCRLTVLPVAKEVSIGSGDKLSLTGSAVQCVYTSSDSSVATVDANGTVTAKKAGSVTITASVNNIELEKWDLTVAAAPTSVKLSATSASLGVGETIHIAATMNNGAPATLTWTSSKASVATVDADGTITAKAAGSATITAKTYNGKTATCKVTVAKAPTSIKLSVANVALGSGDSTAVKATLSSGSAGAVTYESSDPNVATVANGKVVAGNPGTATITASTYNGKTATCKVTVQPAPESVGLGEDLTLGVKQTVQLTPVVTPGSLATFTYSTSDSKTVTVTAAGKITPVKAGTARITVKAHNGVTGSVNVTVVNAPSKVTISATKASLGVGQTLGLTAAVPAGSVSPITWSSNKTGVATVDANGVVTAKKAGTATITAKAYNGKAATCKVTVVKAPTSIKLSVTSVTLGCGDSAAIKATLSSGSAGAITYESTNDRIATVSGGRIVAGQITGTATITATTHNGLSATCTVTVLPAPKSIGLDGNRTLGVGQTLALKPVLTAGSAATLTYATSDKNVATVSSAGAITAKKAGTATITVTAHNGVKASITITVTAAPSKVTLSATKLTLAKGETAQLTATITANTTAALTWSSNKPGVVTVDQNGTITAVAAGTATITVKTHNGKTATCTVTVK